MADNFPELQYKSNTGADLLRRRSFHCNRDLKSMEKLEKAVPWKKPVVNVENSRDLFSGFEAPRNSLDVPGDGSTGLKRRSSIRFEDIPMGYVLSRSSTARRRNDDLLARKSMSSVESILSKSRSFSTENADPNQAHRTQNVVARLMGLEPLPHEVEAHSLRCSSELFSKKTEPHGLARLKPEPCITEGLDTMFPVSSKHCPSLMEGKGSDLKPSMRISKELSLIRDHPQERQLQEFKKELEGKLSTSSKNAELHQESGLQRVNQGGKRETSPEYQEFLDALDFLRRNKEFFIKVLKDPSSLFGKHLQQTGGGASKENLGHLKASKATQKLQEDSLTQDFRIASPRPKNRPRVSANLTTEMAKLDKFQVPNHLESLNNESSNSCMSHFLQDEPMPQCQHRQCSTDKTGNDERMATKIVVLRPKLARHCKETSSVPFHHPPDVFDATKMSMQNFEGRKNTSKFSARERRFCDELASRTHRLNNLSKNNRNVAICMGEQGTKDRTKRHSSDKNQLAGSTLHAQKNSRGSGVHAQRGSTYWHSSNGNSLAGSMARANGRTDASLLDSPRLSYRSQRAVRSENFSDKHRQCVRSGEKNPSRLPLSATIPTDAGKDIPVTEHMSVVTANGKQGSVESLKHQSSTKLGNRGSFNAARKPPKASKRSLSASSVETKRLDQNHLMHVNKLPDVCSNKSRPSESSLFKERLLSLEESLSLTKKKINNTPTSHPCKFAGQNESSGVGESSCTVSSIQTPSSSQAQSDKPSMEGCFHNGMPASRKASDVLYRSPAVGDLFESTSDVSSEKCEQPSPVSVLALPFGEDSPSPKQLMSKLHDASSITFPPEVDCKQQLLKLNGILLSSSTSSPENSTKPVETLSMSGIAYGNGLKDELAYIRDLLAFAGFADNENIEKDSFLGKHGLKQSMFEKMEDHYASRKGTNGHMPLDLVSRKILFDLVNEIVSWRLAGTGSHMGPIFRHAKLGIHIAHTGKQLREWVWALACDLGLVRCNISQIHSLDNLVFRDLMKYSLWMQLSNEIEAVVLGLERSLCGDLIREIAHELMLPS